MTEFYVCDTQFLCQIDKFRKIFDVEGDDGILYIMLFRRVKRIFYGENYLPLMDNTPTSFVTQYIIEKDNYERGIGRNKPL